MPFPLECSVLKYMSYITSNCISLKTKLYKLYINFSTLQQLGRPNSELSDFNKRLIRQFLTFDDEMTQVGGKWRETESAIIKYQ